MNDILERRLIEIVATELQVPVTDVVRGISLRKELGMDSVAAINIVFAVEEEFAIHVPETELEHVDTLDAILALLDRLGPDAGSTPSATNADVGRTGRTTDTANRP